MTPPEGHGPIDFVLIEFQGDRATGAAARELLDLVERGIVRIFDLVLIGKGEDGSVAALDLADPSAAGAAGDFARLTGARSGLLGEDDVAEAAAAMSPGTLAALIVYENSWAAPFVTAAREAGGEVVASARIPAQDVMDALEALEAFDAAV